MSDLYDKFVLTADVIERLSRCDLVVSQAQVTGAVNSSTNVDNNASNDTHASVKDDVVVLSSPVANDDVTVMAEQKEVECDNVKEDSSNVTDGGSIPTSDCRWFAVCSNVCSLPDESQGYLP